MYFKYLMKSVEFVSNSYCISIANISINKWGPDVRVVLTIFILFLRRLRRIFAVTILWSEDTPSEEKYASHFRGLFIHFLFMSK